MSKTTYLIELHVDEQWFKAISEFTADVHEGETCNWVRVDAETNRDINDCDNCEDNPKSDQSEYCTPCNKEFDENLTNDNDDEKIEETPLGGNK